MARLWSCGFELQSTTSGMEWDTTTGTPTINTTTKRGGLASLRCNPTASTAFLTHQYAAALSGVNIYVRFYMYIATSTDALDTVCLMRSVDTNSNVSSVRLNTNRSLELWDEVGAVQIGSDSPILNASQWYRIELAFINSNTVTAYIDGVPFATGSFSNGIPDQIRLGAVTTTTCDLYFEDGAVNNNSGSYQNTLPGPGQIVHFQPNAAGDTNQALSGTFTEVDEVTPDDGTTIAVLDADNDIFDVNCEAASSAGMASTDLVRLIQVGIREAQVSAAASTWKLRLKSAASGTVSEGALTTHNDTTYRTNGDTTPRIYTLTSYTDPTTGIPWTPSGTNSLDNMQIGVQATDATPDINVSALWALVEYVTPGTAQAGKALFHGAMF